MSRTSAHVETLRPAAGRQLMAQGSPLPGTRWYFAAQAADGDAAPGRRVVLRQLLYVLNPNAIPVPVTFTYYPARGSAPLVTHAIVPAASTHVEDIGADLRSLGGPLDQGVAVIVNAPHVISVARVMQHTLTDGAVLNADTTPGVMAPARQWSFAEGYIGQTYREYLTLFNPGPTVARVTVRFARQGTSAPPVAPVRLSVPALGQATLDVRGAYRQASVKSVGLLVESADPVVAARTLYWGGSLERQHFGADAKPGAPLASASWDFTGASVNGQDQSFLTVFAPRGAARVTAWLHTPDGRLLATLRLRVAAGQRATVRLSDQVRGAAGPVGVTLRADAPVVAEMPQYNAGSPNVARHAGDVITGLTGGASYAHLPYLNTGSHAVAALIDVYNPGQGPLNVTVRGYSSTGRQATARLTVAAGHTVQYDVARLGLPRGAFGATLTADGLFVAYAQGYAGGAAEFLSEPAIPLPAEALQAVIPAIPAPSSTPTATPATPATAPQPTNTAAPLAATATASSSPVLTGTPIPATTTAPAQPSATSTATPANTAAATSTTAPTSSATPPPTAMNTAVVHADEHADGHSHAGLPDERHQCVRRLRRRPARQPRPARAFQGLAAHDLHRERLQL